MSAAFIKILVSITLMAMMGAIGLEVSLAELAAAARNWRLTTKAALANYLCIPAVTVSLLLLFHSADATVAAGFLILAVCPARPNSAPLVHGSPGECGRRSGDDGAVGRLVGHCRTSAIARALATTVWPATLCKSIRARSSSRCWRPNWRRFAWGRAYAAGHRGWPTGCRDRQTS